MAVVPLAAAVGASVLPVPPALSPDDQGLTRLLAVIVATVVAALGATLLAAAGRQRRLRLGAGIAVLGLVIGTAAALAASRAARQCTADYAGRAVLVGTDMTPEAAAYRAANPGATDDSLLFDAAGNVEAVWTSESVARCRLTLMATHGVWWPCLVVALAGAAYAVTAGPSLALPHAAEHPGTPVATGTGTAAPSDAPSPSPRRGAPGPVQVRYDAFISYRHGPPDVTAARALAETLEQHGYIVAIDDRDFAPSAHFLTEMERCIRESRFTLALLSERYLYSGPCEEEALICRVLDFGDRQRRLVPLYLEPVDAPAWLHGLVGIALYDDTALVEPVDRLIAALGPPLADTATTTGGDAGR